MSKETQDTPQLAQLKKQDMINAMVPGDRLSRASLKAILAINYSFLDSYVDYLIDHFITLGRIEQHDDETVSRVASRAQQSASRVLYKVTRENGVYDIIKHQIGPDSLSLAELTELGWRQTAAAAVKVMNQLVFKLYKTHAAQLNLLKDNALNGAFAATESMNHPETIKGGASAVEESTEEEPEAEG